MGSGTIFINLGHVHEGSTLRVKNHDGQDLLSAFKDLRQQLREQKFKMRKGRRADGQYLFGALIHEDKIQEMRAYFNKREGKFHFDFDFEAANVPDHVLAKFFFAKG